MKSDNPRFFPMFTDISDWNVLMVGAGRIATRRIETLLAFAGNITVVSREISTEIHKLQEQGLIQVYQREFHMDDLQGRQMVLTATDDSSLNTAIAEECRRQKIPVNVSSDRNLCDFHFPGIVLKDELTVGVNAAGKNHKKVKEIRQLIEEILEDD